MLINLSKLLKKLSKNKKTSGEGEVMDKYPLDSYEFDDGVDPRDLLPQTKGKGRLKGKKLFHESWAEKILEEDAEIYIDTAEDLEKEKEKRAKEMTAIDHDRNSRAKSPMIPVLKNSVASEDWGAPDSRPKKKSFRNLVKRIPGSSGRSKKV